jgi:glycerophosphoryl diester phosphodiesterase
LDEVKSRESELNASPPTFTKNVMIHVCVLLGKTQQTNLSRQKTKKNTLFLSSFACLLFRSHFPLLRSFASKTEGKSKNIFVLETGKKKECRQNQARANKTHARRKKKELARIKSTRTRARKGTR